jgi:hypothetical protein
MASKRRRQRRACAAAGAELEAMLTNKPAWFRLLFEGMAIGYVNIRANPRRELRFWGTLIGLIGGLTLVRLAVHSRPFSVTGLVAYAVVIAVGLRWSRGANTAEGRIPGLTGARAVKTGLAWLAIAPAAFIGVVTMIEAVAPS